MPRRATLKPSESSWAETRNGKSRYRPDIQRLGHRERSFFATKQEAENYCAQVRTRPTNFGLQGAGILPRRITEQAINALELLKPYGISLNEVVQDWLYRRKASEASITYEAAMDSLLGLA